MHVLFINEFYYPDICGSAVVTADHLPKIAALRPDWRVTVLAGNRGWDDPQRIYPLHETRDRVQIVRVQRPVVRRSLISRGLGFLAFARNVRKALKELDKIDVIVGTTAPPQGGILAARVASEVGCPFIYKVFDLYPDSAITLGRLRENSWLHRRWLRQDTEAMQAAARVVPICEPITQRIVRTRAIPKSKFLTILDGFDGGRLQRHGHNSFAHEFNPDRKFVIQYAGNMGLSHPLDTIIDAAAQLQNDPRFLFQMIGEGPAKAAAKTVALRNLKWIPYQPADRLGHLLDGADICLISQHQSMFDLALPYKIYAILAAAKPAIFIGSAKSQVADWLTQSGAGVQINQENTGDLVQSIRNMADAADATKAMGQAGRRLFAERFDSSVAVKRWVELIELVHSARSNRPSSKAG